VRGRTEIADDYQKVPRMDRKIIMSDLRLSQRSSRTSLHIRTKRRYNPENGSITNIRTEMGMRAMP
jgi:hypothetical protein